MSELRFKVKSHRTSDGHYVGQVLLAGVVVHEDTGPVGAGQAEANVRSSFADLLRSALEAEGDRQVSLVGDGQVVARSVDGQ